MTTYLLKFEIAFYLFKKLVVTIRLAPIVHLGGTWGGVSGKRRAANGKRRAAHGKRQTGNEKSWSLIFDKFQQFATMLFSHWPLAYIILTNTGICKKAEKFRRSSIFTIMNIFFYCWFGQGKMMKANFSHFEPSYWVIVTITNADFIHTKHVKHF